MRRKKSDREKSTTMIRKFNETLLMMDAIKVDTYRVTWKYANNKIGNLYYGGGRKKTARRFNRQNRSDDISTI